MDYFLQLKKLPHNNFDIVIPFLKFEKELARELFLQNKEVFFKNDKILMVERLSEKPIWAQDWWTNCEKFEITSKSQLLKLLKAEKNLGVYYPSTSSALADSTRKDLRELKLKRIEYKVPSDFDFRFFSWTMIENHTAIIARNATCQFPLGWHEFNEDKATPPNRAYLKLWEILCLNYIQLTPENTVIDLGSSPGGWSWVLSQNVKKVYSIDKAQLDDKIANIPQIVFNSEDAFKVKPQDYLDCQWLFSDIICTPDRLLSLIQHWQLNSKVENFVCTIKFKGDCDFNILKEFLKIENSFIIHLYQNKNEVTWIKTKNGHCKAKDTL